MFLFTVILAILPVTASIPMLHSFSIVRQASWLGSITSDLFANIRNQTKLQSLLDNDHNWNRLSGVFLTGASGGIGEALCWRLSRVNVSTTITARPEKLSNLHAFATKINNATESNLFTAEPLDLYRLCRYWDQHQYYTQSQHHGLINAVIHGAGLMAPRASEEEIMHVNSYSPLALTILLLPRLISSVQQQELNPVVVFVSSSSHLRGKPFDSSSTDIRQDINSLTAYANAKLHMMLAGTALQKRLESTGILIRFVHPGIVDTPMLQSYFGRFAFWGRSKLLRSPAEGAAAVILPVLSAINEQRLDTARADCAKDSKDSTNAHDYRRLYYVDGVSSPQRCSPYLNDAEACENSFRDSIRVLPPSMRAYMSSQLRISAHSIPISPSKDASNLITERNQRCRSALLSLAQEVEQ